MRGFVTRAALQLGVASTQVIILALFVAVLPLLDMDPTNWAAEYFISLAVTGPVFMLFGFELRKYTAAAELSELAGLNSKRMWGTVLAVVVSVVLLLVLIAFKIVTAPSIYLALLVFKMANAVNDQISANYESVDRHGDAVRSNMLKTVVFIVVALGTAILADPTVGVIAGSFGFVLVWATFDRQRVSGVFTFAWHGGFLREDWFLGFGSFLVSLTLNLPRLFAAAFLDDTVVVLLGIGQSLNRLGQLLSAALTQALIATQKRIKSGSRGPLLFSIAVQVIAFVGMILALPIWSRVFAYADRPVFTPVLIAVLFFGLLSQLNYIIQSLIMVHVGGRAFLYSPIVFLVGFCAILFGVAVIFSIGLYVLLTAMIAARIVQMLWNTRTMWRGRWATPGVD